MVESRRYDSPLSGHPHMYNIVHPVLTVSIAHTVHTIQHILYMLCVLYRAVDQYN